MDFFVSMLIPKEDSEGKLKDYSPIFMPQDILRLADRQELPKKIITYATNSYLSHLRQLIHTHDQSTCIFVIPNDQIYDFYFKGLHLHFAFAYNKGYYKSKERWPLVFETPSHPTDHIIKKLIKFWAHVSGVEEDGRREEARVSNPQVL